MYDNSTHKEINYPLLIFIVIQIIFFIMCGVSIKNIFTDDKIDPNDYSNIPSISIEGLPSEIPSQNKKIIENEILNMVNQNIQDVNLSEAKAKVRSDSLKTHFFETQNLNYMSAIIDLPTLGQSYQIFHEYSDDQNNEYLDPNGAIIALCITNPNDIVYNDFACHDIYDQKTRNSLAQKYIEFVEFDNFYAYGSPESPDEIIIRVLQGSTNTNATDKYIEEVKATIQSLGIQPELFSYSIY